MNDLLNYFKSLDVSVQITVDAGEKPVTVHAHVPWYYAKENLRVTEGNTIEEALEAMKTVIEILINLSEVN